MGKSHLKMKMQKKKKQRSVNKYVAKTKFCCKTDIGRQKTEELRERERKGNFLFQSIKKQNFHLKNFNFGVIYPNIAANAS